MKIHEISETKNIVETKLVWARKGGKIARKYRCTFGRRKGRVVASPGQCSKPVDMRKRFTLRKTKAQKGSKMSRKAQRTKRTSAASKMVRALNRSTPKAR